MRIHAIAALALLAGCPVKRVTVPTDPSLDAPPIITLTAVPITPTGPGAIGDVEPGKSNVSTTTSVQVSRDSGVQLIGNARNEGGVKTFAISIARHGMPFLKASASQDVDAAGTALNTLTLRNPDGAPNSSIDVKVSDPIEVTATATNFNGQTTTITVTYTPADLQVTLVASPTTIGYQAAGQATLTWSVLYGVPPIKIDLSDNLAPEPVPAIGSATVAPKQTTQYYLGATDQKGTRAATATVTVRQPPPPPSVKLSASPNDGYNCIDTTDTLAWNVSNCGADCHVTLSGHGFGYAQKFQISLPNLPANGSYSTNPADQIDFTVTATSPFGSNSASKSLRIASPSVCPGGSTQPSLAIFYFAVKASSDLVEKCNWLAVWADTEDNAQAAVERAYGSTYTVTSITEDDYNHQLKCP